MPKLAFKSQHNHRANHTEKAEPNSRLYTLFLTNYCVV